MGRQPSNERACRPQSKGRQRIQIVYIEDKAKRLVTFSKRKSGLFKKAGELAQLCGAHVAVMLFSEAGRPFAFGSPSVDSVLRRLSPRAPYPDYEDYDDEAERAAAEATRQQAEETWALVDAEKDRMAAIGEKVLEALAPGKRFWWEADAQQLGPAELPEFTRALMRLRDKVQRHANNMRSDASPTPLLLKQ